MHTVRFRLTLSAEQLMRYYRGTADQVVVRAEDGRRIQFPAVWLRPYVEADGARGRFEMQFGDDHRLIRLRRIADD